jgi:hypothetical protein
MTAYRPAARAAAAAALAAAAACSDSPTAPGPGDASRDASEFRRLLVADDSANFARLYDLSTFARVDSMGGLPSAVTYLYSPTGRVAFAHFQTQHRVLFIDGGIAVRDGRATRGTPRVLGSHQDQTPIHGNYLGSIASAHFDGSGNVSFWDEASVAAGMLAPMLTVNSGPAHHGAAMVKPGGQYVSASVRAVGGTGPDGVYVFDRQSRLVDSSRACPGLHGLAGNETGVLYGCNPGALHVSVTNGRAVFTSLTRADDPRARVASVWAREGQPRFLVRMTIPNQPVTPATRQLGVADVAARTLQPVDLGADLDWTADIDHSGRHALVIGRSGTLYVVDMSTRAVTGRIADLVAPMPATGTVRTPAFAHAAGVTYVSSPARQEVVEVTLRDGAPSVSRRLPVSGIPTRLVVLGARAAGSLVAAN